MVALIKAAVPLLCFTLLMAAGHICRTLNIGENKVVQLAPKEKRAVMEEGTKRVPNLHPAPVNATTLPYCNTTNCMEPDDIKGEWVLRSIHTVSRNECAGWKLGKRCENGYAYNIECKAYTDHYQWVGQDMDSFSAVESCQLLGNRTVLLVGDSTMGQTFSALSNRHHPFCSDRFVFALADTLVNREMGVFNRGDHWTHYVESIQPDLVIFGVGAHVYGEVTWKDTFEELIVGMTAYNEQPNTKTIPFIYKTHVPGGCSNEIRYPNAVDEAARSFNEYQHQHGEFYGRDLYAISRLRQLGWPVLDMRMLYARSDSHPSSASWPGNRRKADCLHMCSPGPLDVVADVFQQYLQDEMLPMPDSGTLAIT